MTVRIAINDKQVGKLPDTFPTATEKQLQWRTVNGGFTNVKLPVEDLIKFIRVYGYSYTAQHKRWRASKNFIRGQHIGLDFDSSGFDAILRDDFIFNNASFLHTTASHTERNPRSRVIFILEKPLTAKYSLATAAFANHWGDADKACKDPVRLFFGAPGCDIHYLGNTLSLEAAATIVRPYKEQQEKRVVLARREYNGSRPALAIAILNRLTEKVLMAPNGTKHTTLLSAAYEAGGHVGGGVLDEAEAISALYTAICQRRCRDYDHARRTIERGVADGQLVPLYAEDRLDPVTAKLFEGVYA